MSSASVSPVLTSETSSSPEDRFTCGDCGSKLVSMENWLLFSRVPPILSDFDGGNVEWGS